MKDARTSYKILEDKTVVTVQWQELQYGIKPKTG